MNNSPSDLWAAFDDALQPDGFHIDGYEILGELGRGGMGSIYHARQLNPEREVALKVLLPKFGSDPDMHERFQTEARAMAALDHPGILPIYEVGEADGLPFFSMKLAAGGSLAERLKSDPIPPKQAVTWTRAIASALHHAHQHGVLHRDLKPGNFLFDEQDRIYVADFGVAKLLASTDPSLTKTEAFVGTPFYMPPEIAGGSTSEATTSGDLYSLAAVLYEMLGAKRPHPDHENIPTLLRSIADDPVPPLAKKVPLDLNIICLKSLSKSPEDRYPSVHSLSEDLHRWQEGHPIQARPIPLLPRIWRWAKRHPLPAGLAAALILTAITGGILLSQSYQKSQTRLHASLVDQARAERILAAPGHREEVLDLLRQAHEISPSPLIRDEAIATLSQTDVVSIQLENETPPWQPTSPPDDPHSSIFNHPSQPLALASHQSGKLILWDLESQKITRQWLPANGQIVVTDFLGDTPNLIHAGTLKGLTVIKNGQEKIIPFPSPIRFLTASSSGDQVILGGPNGIALLDLTLQKIIWEKKGQPMRCPPAFSPGALFIAASLGEAKQVTIFSSQTGEELSTHPTSGWPLHLALNHICPFLAVIGDDSTLSLINPSSGKLIARLDASTKAITSFDSQTILQPSTSSAWEIQPSIGLNEWRGHIFSQTSSTTFGARRSSNQKLLLTTTTAGVEIWNLDLGYRRISHAVENQRIDARTQAWWLPDSISFIVQIPGGLEKITLREDEDDDRYTVEKVPRLPGSTILDILPNGDWLTEIRDEDDNRSHQLWPQGNFNQGTPTNLSPSSNPLQITACNGTQTAQALPDSTIQLTGLFEFKLTPPGRPKIIQILFLEETFRLIAITEDYRILAWDLLELELNLEKAGL